MIQFLARRVCFGVVVLWLISVVVFLLFYVAPTDVARLLAGRQASEQLVDTIRQNLGLDDPILVQYGRFLGNLLTGDLGYSYYSNQPVTDLVADRLPVTISLGLGGAVLWLAIGVAIGVVSARRPRSVADRTATAAALFFYSMPTFLLGLLLLYFLFYRLQLAGIDAFPPGGYVPLSRDPAEWARHLVLPWLTLALVQAALYVRLTRGSLLDVLGEDFIRTARAKGLRPSRVTVVHGLRAGLTPMVTQLGIDLGTLLGGVIITETVFSLPGLGQLAISSVTTQDRPVIIGIVLLGAAFIVVANILVDAAYALLDPRVRTS